MKNMRTFTLTGFAALMMITIASAVNANAIGGKGIRTGIPDRDISTAIDQIDIRCDIDRERASIIVDC